MSMVSYHVAREPPLHTRRELDRRKLPSLMAPGVGASPSSKQDGRKWGDSVQQLEPERVSLVLFNKCNTIHCLFKDSYSKRSIAQGIQYQRMARFDTKCHWGMSVGCSYDCTI